MYNAYINEFPRNVSAFEGLTKVQRRYFDMDIVIHSKDSGAMKKFGVYAIMFPTSHGYMYYIGSTARSFLKRLEDHYYELTHQKHVNPKLQNYWNKYSKVAEFRILEICLDASIVAIREQSYLDSMDKNTLLNLGSAFPNSMAGKKHTDEARKKMSLAQTGRKHSLETLMKMSVSGKGRITTEEAKEKLRQANLGKRATLETRLKMTLSRIGKKQSLETKEKKRQALIKIKNDPVKHEDRVSAAKRGWIKRKAKLNE